MLHVSRAEDGIARAMDIAISLRNGWTKTSAVMARWIAPARRAC